MMPRPVNGWLSDDGKFFETEEEAEKYEADRDFIRFMNTRGGGHDAEARISCLIRDAEQLYPILRRYLRARGLA